jgi:predicted AlkP superfamily pyrophosphatase or phosphodiesterase
MIQYPDYENSIVNIPNSVLAYFGTEPNDKTMPELDKLLAKGYSNVVVMLFDALGTEVLNRHLPSDSFLRKHVLKSVSSVYPTTTVSATTAIESGLMPNRHAWFGWTMYFPQVEKTWSSFAIRTRAEEVPPSIRRADVSVYDCPRR